MYCNHCGKNLEPGTVCCPYCGQKAESLSGGTGFWDLTDEPRSQTPQQQAAQPAPPAPPVRPAASRPEAPEQKQPNGTQPQAGNNLLAVVAAVLAAGALILGAVNLVQVKKLQKNVRELAARQTEQSAGENMPEPSAMPTVTPEAVTPAETTAPAVSEEPTPTVSPETEASTAETTSPAVSPNTAAENQSDFKLELGRSEDDTSVAVQQNDKGQLCLYFYADGVDTNQYEILWWKQTNVDAEPAKFSDGATQSNKVDENIVLTDADEQEEYSVFFTVYEKGADGNALYTSNQIHVLENKLLEIVPNGNELSYNGRNGFGGLLNNDSSAYTIIWQTADKDTENWKDVSEEKTLTLDNTYKGKRIRVIVKDSNGTLLGFTEYTEK